MRFFQDDVLTRRVAGLALLLGLVWVLARGWRERIVEQSSYATVTYDSAQALTQTLGALALACALFVAVSLIATPRPGSED
jgi:hypothetical protein